MRCSAEKHGEVEEVGVGLTQRRFAPQALLGDVLDISQHQPASESDQKCSSKRDIHLELTKVPSDKSCQRILLTHWKKKSPQKKHCRLLPGILKLFPGFFPQACTGQLVLPYSRLDILSVLSRFVTVESSPRTPSKLRARMQRTWSSLLKNSHVILSLLKFGHPKRLSIELRPMCRNKHGPSELWPRIQCLIHTLDQPFAKSLPLVFSQNVDVSEICKCHFVCDESSQSYLFWIASSYLGQSLVRLCKKFRVLTSNISRRIWKLIQPEACGILQHLLQ